jgi:hypothetical protein
MKADAELKDARLSLSYHMSLIVAIFNEFHDASEPEHLTPESPGA